MKTIKCILIFSMLMAPVISFAHDDNGHQSDLYSWANNDNYQTNSYYNDDFSRDSPRHDYKERQYRTRKQHSKKVVRGGWDIDTRVAKRASNCYRYTLSSKGGKGSARITSIPGKNYIQVNGQKSGFVCFQGEPTLELGKLANPNVKVTFKLEGKGKYGFHQGDTGSRYKNHWYRSYWNL